MSFGPLAGIPGVGTVLRGLARWRVAEKVREIEPLLRPRDRILDIGSGNGVLCHALRERGYSVVPVDVRDGSFLSGVRPTIYDGEHLPFTEGGLDVALLITVLHHVARPETLLAEAKRVAHRIVLIEETYRTTTERLLTHAIDSVFNLEFVGHPHSNKTDAEWRATFDALALDLVSAGYTRSLGVLRRVTYLLESHGVA